MSMSAGRPKLDDDGLQPLNVGIRGEELDALRLAADKEQLSISAVVRLALRQYLGLSALPEKKIA